MDTVWVYLGLVVAILGVVIVGVWKMADGTTPPVKEVNETESEWELTD